ncbi:MAG: aspartate/glutamate racemase family protein [Woeseiaceae bacterium]
MSRKKILVINPNSNETVTTGLRESLRGFASEADIDCCTLENGPFGIETDEDILKVAPMVCQKVLDSGDYDAFVIACYSDPGLKECRENTRKPVLGMQESAVRAAAVPGGKFGVLALSDASIQRHLRYINELGYADQLAVELPLNITVDEAANADDTVDKVVAAGLSLLADHDVSALILGCAGMAATKEAAETKLPVPVIEPAQAAVRFAIDAARSTSARPPDY